MSRLSNVIPAAFKTTAKQGSNLHTQNEGLGFGTLASWTTGWTSGTLETDSQVCVPHGEHRKAAKTCSSIPTVRGKHPCTSLRVFIVVF